MDDDNSILNDNITIAGSNGISATDLYSSYSSTITLPNSYTISNGTWGSIGASSYPYITTGTGTSSNSIDVQGDANFEGDITLKGKSLGKFMETMEKRLAILQPDPKKLKKFQALQKAYEHYKLLEALCEADDENQQ
jgi:hypothetical protein